jgi:integrase/recombinase XerD
MTSLHVQRFTLERSTTMTPLRQRMLEDMQIRNFSQNTRESYLQQVSLFARHFRRSPEGLGPADIRAYQLYLTKEKKLATSSIQIATCALRFLYSVTMKRPWDVEEPWRPPKIPRPWPLEIPPPLN